MELRHLRYFIAVAESLSFTAAARRLHISQPPLSQQIRDLEAELGTALLTRTNRRVALTEAGAAFLDHARAILMQVERAVEQSRSIGAGRAGTLEIGLTGSILPGGLGALIAAYRARFPGVSVRLHEMAPDAQEAALVERRLDASFLRHPGDGALRTEPAWKEAVVAALPRGHRLAAKRALRLVDLRTEPFVFFRRADSRFARHLWSCCIDAGFEPEVVQEVVEAHSVISLVAGGFGVALLPEFVSRLSPGGVTYRKLAGLAASADVSMAYHPDHGPVVAEFLAFARSRLRS